MNIGSNIKYLRQKNKITQEQLADHLGVSYQAVSKWETNANTPDISLLPEIASFFGVTIDSLFADNVSEISDSFSGIKDDDVIRIVQMRGKKIIDVAETFSPDCPPIQIAFPRDCNDRTHYFKVEVFGHVIADSYINGDVIFHKCVHCGGINGDVKTEGDVYANVINSMGRIVCKNITDCYKLTCSNIECEGSVNCHIVIK